MSLTNLDTYLNDRENLIKRDKALRVDAIKLDNLSKTEAAAEEIVRAMRAEEAVSVWAADYSNLEHPFPGMEFLTSRSMIMKTKVFHLLHKVHFHWLFFVICSDVRLWVDRCPRVLCFTPIWMLPSTCTFYWP